MKHHTKDKGDLGVAKVIADLTEKEFKILTPLSEHLPFDLVIYKNFEFKRVQVKYKSSKENVIRIDLRSCWSDKNGSHSSNPDGKEIDIIAIYCPETNTCYYIKMQDLNKDQSQFSLRLCPAKSHNQTKIRIAEDYKSP